MSGTARGTAGKRGNAKHWSPDLAMWLEKRRNAEGLSLRKVAARTGVSHATIAEIINGDRPSAATIVKLAAAFAGDGQHQRAALEDLLLTLSGYKSKPEALSEPLGRLMDKMSHFNEAQLAVIEEFADFVAKLGVPRA